jgi:type I restriction enzyme R subunit
MSFTPPSYLEDHASQVPAARLLLQLGYSYLRPIEVHAARGQRGDGVLLETILLAQLRRLNQVSFKGRTQPFSEDNLRAAIAALAPPLDDGLLRANERILDLLMLGKSFEEEIVGDRKSFTLRYVDWENPAQNAWHFAAELEITPCDGGRPIRLDLVLFVNGIPFAVIENKRPGGKEWPRDAIAQLLRYQRPDQVPQLFAYSQVLLILNGHDARYGTVGTAEKFWTTWQERHEQDAALRTLLNRPLTAVQKDALFADRFAYLRDYFSDLEIDHAFEVDAQARLLHSLCRPERLLEFARKFTLFDAGEKKVARHQQFFVVQNTLARVQQFDLENRREGGVIWHTQGSGKSLSMVMLAKALALEPSIPNPQILLVTDRVDLDRQIERTFRQCGLVPVRARTGKHLRDLLSDDRRAVITTVLKKFSHLVRTTRNISRNPNLFVLVDESHRSHYGAMHAEMRLALPGACYLGFTGTPLMHAEKNTAIQFGGFIEPTYTLNDALRDKAIVPLLYEGRHILQSVDHNAIDQWFDRVSEPLSEPQKTALKHKLGTRRQLNEVDSKLQLVAYDIGQHFSENLQTTGARGMIAVQSKAVALKMKAFLDEFGKVTSEVVISAPERPEDEEEEKNGYEAASEEDKSAIRRHWQRLLDRYGSEEAFLESVTGGFIHGEGPELLIVVHKLLVGFDAPRNTVLYLCRKLEGHALLQAIARVNRLYPGKEYGLIVDYYGIIRELGAALDLYGALPQFDADDLAATLRDISDEVDNLRQRHSELLDVFKSLGARADPESCERLLYDDDDLRKEFYERLSRFSRTLALALSTADWLKRTPPDQVDRYKRDLVRFQAMRTALKQRCAEDIDHAEYEARVRKLLNTHVKSNEVLPITALTNIHEREKFQAEIERLGSDRAKADTIASRLKRTFTERMAEDPFFFRKLSRIIEDIIAEHRAERLSDAEYLGRMKEAYAKATDSAPSGTPRELDTRPAARAFFGVLQDVWQTRNIPGDAGALQLAAALELERIVLAERKRDWTRNEDVQNAMRSKMDDYLHDVKDQHGLPLDFDAIDLVIEGVLSIARVHYRQ